MFRISIKHFFNKQKAVFKLNNLLQECSQVYKISQYRGGGRSLNPRQNLSISTFPRKKTAPHFPNEIFKGSPFFSILSSLVKFWQHSLLLS